MEWVGPDGSEYSCSFDDALDAARSGQRLRTALSLTGEWLPAVLDQAHEQLTAIRASQPHAGGLIIAIDHEHAKGIVELMRRRHGVTPTLVLSDDPTASARIEHFAEGSMPWIVAVRMVSEGVDIPRLRVGVFATNTATELFFRQAAGRLVRWTRGMRHQKAFFFIPDDPRLRTFAAQIAEQRRHSLRRRDDDDRSGPDPETLDELSVGVQEEQLSLFSVISAVALGSPTSRVAGRRLRLGHGRGSRRRRRPGRLARDRSGAPAPAGRRFDAGHAVAHPARAQGPAPRRERRSGPGHRAHVRAHPRAGERRAQPPVGGRQGLRGHGRAARDPPGPRRPLAHPPLIRSRLRMAAGADRARLAVPTLVGDTPDERSSAA